MIKPQQIIYINSTKKAIVARVISDTEVEVVYKQDGGKHILEDAVFIDDVWTFKHSGPSGSYADNISSYRDLIRQLQQL